MPWGRRSSGIRGILVALMGCSMPKPCGQADLENLRSPRPVAWRFCCSHAGDLPLAGWGPGGSLLPEGALRAPACRGSVAGLAQPNGWALIKHAEVSLTSLAEFESKVQFLDHLGPGEVREFSN